MDEKTIVVVYHKHKLKNEFDMYIPDLGITVDGTDITSLNAKVYTLLSAIMWYYEEHGIPLEFKTTYDEAGRFRKTAADYVSYLPLK